MDNLKTSVGIATLGIIIIYGIAASSYAADPCLSQVNAKPLELISEITWKELDYKLPKEKLLGEIPDVKINNKNNTLRLNEDYKIKLKFDAPPKWKHTLRQSRVTQAKNGQRFNIRKNTEIEYQLPKSHNLYYHVTLPKDTELNIRSSNDPKKYALAKETTVSIIPPSNRLIKLTLPAQTFVDRLPGSADMGTTIQVEPTRAPVGGFITLTIAKDDFDFSKAKFEVCFRIQDDNNANNKPFIRSNSVELKEIRAEKAKLLVRIPVMPNAKGLHFAKSTDILMVAQGPEDKIAEIVTKNFKISSRSLASILWIIAGILPWATAAFIATKRARIDIEEVRERRKIKRIDPIWFVSGKYGRASLSLAQILLWTVLVYSASFYVLVASGKLLDLSTEVLILLGITGTSSVIAKIATSAKEDEGRVISDEGPMEPKWRNLVQTEGRPDLYKFQMLLFTSLAAIFVILKIAAEYEFPALPTGLLTLIGISNGVYIAAKASESTVFEKLASKDRDLQNAIKTIETRKIDADKADKAKIKAEKELNEAVKLRDTTKEDLNKATNQKEQEKMDKLEQLLEKHESALKEAKITFEKTEEKKSEADKALEEAELEKTNINKVFEDLKKKITKIK